MTQRARKERTNAPFLPPGGLALALVSIAGCHQALVDSDYQNQTLFSAHFTLDVFQDFDIDSVEHPRWALFEMPEGLGGDICDVEELPESGHPFALGDAELNVFSAPDDALLTTAPSGVRYGLLRAMAYEDSNDDGRKDPDERFIGDAAGGLMYLPEAVSAEDGPTGVALAAGFHNVFWDGPCSAPPRGDDADNCGEVPLGSPCAEDSDCGEQGTCLTTEPAPGWAGGYCAIPASPTRCAPKDGRLFVHRSPDLGETKWWIQACERDADCRTDDGYTCNPMIGACYRAPSMRVVVGRGSKHSSCTQWTLDSASSGDEPAGDGMDDAGMPDMDDAGMPDMDDAGMPDMDDAGMPPMSGMDDAGMPDMDDAGMPPMSGMDDAGMPPMSGMDNGGGPPPDCVPPDPRCDGIPGNNPSDGPAMDPAGPHDELADLCGAGAQ